MAILNQLEATCNREEKEKSETAIKTIVFFFFASLSISLVSWVMKKKPKEAMKLVFVKKSIRINFDFKWSTKTVLSVLPPKRDGIWCLRLLAHIFIPVMYVYSSLGHSQVCDGLYVITNPLMIFIIVLTLKNLQIEKICNSLHFIDEDFHGE